MAKFMLTQMAKAEAQPGIISQTKKVGTLKILLRESFEILKTQFRNSLQEVK